MKRHDPISEFEKAMAPSVVSKKFINDMLRCDGFTLRRYILDEPALTDAIERISLDKTSQFTNEMRLACRFHRIMDAYQQATFRRLCRSMFGVSFE